MIFWHVIITQFLCFIAFGSLLRTGIAGRLAEIGWGISLGLVMFSRIFLGGAKCHVVFTYVNIYLLYNQLYNIVSKSILYINIFQVKALKAVN